MEGTQWLGLGNDEVVSECLIEAQLTYHFIYIDNYAFALAHSLSPVIQLSRLHASFSLLTNSVLVFMSVIPR